MVIYPGIKAMQSEPWAPSLPLLTSQCSAGCLGVNAHQPQSLELLAAGIWHSSVPVPCSHSEVLARVLRELIWLKSREKRKKVEFDSGLIHQSGGRHDHSIASISSREGAAFSLSSS